MESLPQKIEQREELVFDELSRMAQPHADSSNGLFSVLPHNEAMYPAQGLKTWRIDGNPQDCGTVEAIATGIEPRFGELVDNLAHQEANNQLISRIGQQLRAEQNIILVTNHSDLKDIAYTLAAYYISLKGMGYSFHSSLVMSKIVTFLGVGGYNDPASNILKNVCDEEYFSFPRTQSIKNSRIGNTLVDTYNTSVRAAMVHRLNQGGNLFAMAPSGTTDKPMPGEDPNKLYLGKLGNGTAKLMATKHSLVLPMAVWLEHGQLVFEPCDVPTRVNTPEEAHNIMAKIAVTLTQKVAGKTFIYSN